MLIVRKNIYNRRNAQRFLKSYERLVNAFIVQPSIALDKPGIFDAIVIDRALSFSRGSYCPILNIPAVSEGLPSDQWIIRATDQGMHPSLVALLQAVAAQGGLVFPKL